MSNPEKDPQPTVCRPGAAPTRGGLRSGVVVADGENGPVEIPVSYTHLTLPTKA